MHRYYSALLVTAQFVLIALLFSPLSIFFPADSLLKIVGLLFVFDAAALAIWALVCMRIHNFSVMPEPKANASLITHGPYRFVRHPMYSAVLLACLGALLIHGSIVKCIFWLLLAIVLLLKIKREESLLSSQYEDYEKYQGHTKALIPGIL